MPTSPTGAPARPDRLPLPDCIVPARVNWPYVIGIGSIHALALLALLPWLFSWTGLIVMVAGVFFFGQSINLCYHRVLTHRSCVLPKWLEHFYVVLALCCLQDTPAKWIAVHRYHHQHSDHQEDPHSPLVTFLWAHVGWLCVKNESTHSLATLRKYAPDVLKDPFYMKLEKSYTWLLYFAAHALLFAGVGFAIGALAAGPMEGLRMSASLLVWGVFARVVAVWHITWSVNSVTHAFGYKNHETDDESRNNWLVALLAVGEGWHNNHHADPASATNQHRWWELDITYMNIWALEKLGLAKKVRAPRHVRHARRAAASGNPGSTIEGKAGAGHDPARDPTTPAPEHAA